MGDYLWTFQSPYYDGIVGLLSSVPFAFEFFVSLHGNGGWWGCFRFIDEFFPKGFDGDVVRVGFLCGGMFFI